MPMILAIDDKEDNLIVISALLKSRISNCNVITAQSGPEGLKKVKAASPDTILLDIKMPGMDGYEVCKRLKEDERTRYIPVIMFTAIKIEPRDRVSGLEAGADAYLAKPVDESVLIAHVNAMLRIKRAEDTLRKEKDSLEKIVQERTRELRESEKKYRLLAENARDIIWTMDMGRRFTYVSPSVTRLWGYSVEEFMDRKLQKVLTPDSFEVAEKAVKKAQALEKLEEKDLGIGRTWVAELEIIRKDGSTVWTEMATGLIYNKDVRDIEIIGIARDITERKRSEEEKKKLEAELLQAQKMEAIGTLAGGIAHDFNNILASIMGYAELAMLDVPDGSRMKQYLIEIFKAGNRAKNLVNQILAFSRQSNQKQVPIHMRSIVEETIKLLMASLPATIEIRRNIEKCTGTVKANFTQIHQVLMNLCTNAHHAMSEEGGVLEISLSEIELDSHTASRYPDLSPGKYARLTVSDTGYGMDKAVLKRIFEPYFTTKEVGKGTGLGLAAVHGILKDHGGEITVYSEPEKGTTFHVYLPVIEKAEEPEKKTLKSLPTGHERILFIDDEPGLVDVGKQILEKLGYEVVAGTSSVEALELFRSEPEKFDIVITDMTMPQMTGDKLARKIMQIRPDIPIILCTGFSERITDDKAKKMGIKMFAMKPLVMRDLAVMVRKALEIDD